MKLRNKKTGEIGEAGLISTSEGKIIINNTKDVDEWYEYSSLAELNEEWEDYEEPKEYWYIDPMVCGIYYTKIKKDKDLYEFNKQIGNYFSSREEAEKEVEKLKAFKRLKDKGFRFNGKEVFSEGLLEIDGVLPALKGADNTERLKIIDDLDLIFGGEE